MKILIDGRFYGLENAGIGRYVINLVSNLVDQDKTNSYYLLLRKKYFYELNLPSNWQKVEADFRHYSLVEQYKLPKIVASINPDICHYPHFNIPIFSKAKFIVTIHDFIKHDWKGSQTTTHKKFLYWLKYLGYLFIFRKAIENSYQIIVPSQEIKKQVIKKFSVNGPKISVTYEGVEEKWFKKDLSTIDPSLKILMNKKFIFYTGSVYPHKNIDRLLYSIKLLNQDKDDQEKVNLYISSSRNVFLTKVEKKVFELGLKENVKLLGFVSDDELRFFYKRAQAFVFPSLSEGFGLPALEAMATGCPVICSDIPIFREIYDDAALFFNGLDVKDIKDKIELIISDKKIKQSYIDKGLKQVKKYSWPKLAKETLSVYLEAAR